MMKCEILHTKNAPRQLMDGIIGILFIFLLLYIAIYAQYNLFITH